MTTQRMYKAPDGNAYPLEEATYGFSFKVYRTDCKRSIVGDPQCCLIANGIRRQKGVVEAYIGSGRDAYVIFDATPEKHHVHAVHFVVPRQAARVRDEFDKNKKAQSQILLLEAPSASRTLDARQKSDKARREEIKNGAPVKPRGKSRQSRIMRIGMVQRPRAKISKKSVEIAQPAWDE